MNRISCKAFGCCLFILCQLTAKAQNAPLLLSAAIRDGISQYQTIQAKKNYYRSSQELVKNVRTEYLPNIVAGIQDAYGTVNGQFGPLSIGNVAGVSSSGPAFSKQSWAAAFGAQYVINTNWEVFTFGRLQSRVAAFQARAFTDSADIAQEQFIQSVKIADAYLNLLITQIVITTAKADSARISYVQRAVIAKAKSGLIAGVDSSVVNAQVSAARIAILDAEAQEQRQRNQFTQLINSLPGDYNNLDTAFFFNQVPALFNSDVAVEQNPQVQWYQSRVAASDKYASFLQKSVAPALNIFGIVQTRGSGFDYNYTPEYKDRFSGSLWDGINPTRTNYVTGVSIAWNIMSLAKIKHQVSSQRFLSKGYANETDLVTAQLKNQLVLADQRITNTLQRFREVPLQYKAASDAYIQRSVLYKNGLTDINDLQQALYALSKAQTDLKISYIYVWQSLLQKVAANGDFNLFLNQIR